MLIAYICIYVYTRILTYSYLCASTISTTRLEMTVSEHAHSGVAVSEFGWRPAEQPNFLRDDQYLESKWLNYGLLSTNYLLLCYYVPLGFPSRTMSRATSLTNLSRPPKHLSRPEQRRACFLRHPPEQHPMALAKYASLRAARRTRFRVSIAWSRGSGLRTLPGEPQQTT